MLIEISNLLKNPNYPMECIAKGIHIDRKMFYIF